jgi:hypothetical protein
VIQSKNSKSYDLGFLASNVLRDSWYDPGQDYDTLTPVDLKVFLWRKKKRRRRSACFHLDLALVALQYRKFFKFPKQAKRSPSKLLLGAFMYCGDHRISFQRYYYFSFNTNNMVILEEKSYILQFQCMGYFHL